MVTTKECREYIHTDDEIREIMMDVEPRNKFVRWARERAHNGKASKSLMVDTARNVYLGVPISDHDVEYFHVTKKAVKETKAWKKDLFDIERFSFVEIPTRYAYVDEASGFVRYFEQIQVDLFIN